VIHIPHMTYYVLHAYYIQYNLCVTSILYVLHTYITYVTHLVHSYITHVICAIHIPHITCYVLHAFYIYHILWVLQSHLHRTNLHSYLHRTKLLRHTPLAHDIHPCPRHRRNTLQTNLQTHTYLHRTNLLQHTTHYKLISCVRHYLWRAIFIRVLAIGAGVLVRPGALEVGVEGADDVYT